MGRKADARAALQKVIDVPIDAEWAPEDREWKARRGRCKQKAEGGTARGDDAVSCTIAYESSVDRLYSYVEAAAALPPRRPPPPCACSSGGGA